MSKRPPPEILDLRNNSVQVGFNLNIPMLETVLLICSQAMQVWLYKKRLCYLMKSKKFFFPVSSFIGKGIISCSPSRVWETLKKPEARYHFDNMLKVTVFQLVT